MVDANTFVSSDGSIRLTQTGPTTATLVENGQTLSVAKIASNGKDYVQCYVEEFGLDAAMLQIWLLRNPDRLTLLVSHAWMSNGLSNYNATDADEEGVAKFLAAANYPKVELTPPVPKPPS